MINTRLRSFKAQPQRQRGLVLFVALIVLVAMTLAGIGMISGLLIYIFGSRYLPPEPLRVAAQARPAIQQRWYEAGMAQRFALLAGICGVVVVFRGAYEQIGNTLPLWIEHVDRSVGSFVIPMTWFQSLNPLLVFLLTPWFNLFMAIASGGGLLLCGKWMRQQLLRTTA